MAHKSPLFWLYVVLWRQNSTGGDSLLRPCYDCGATPSSGLETNLEIRSENDKSRFKRTKDRCCLGSNYLPFFFFIVFKNIHRKDCDKAFHCHLSSLWLSRCSSRCSCNLKVPSLLRADDVVLLASMDGSQCALDIVCLMIHQRSVHFFFVQKWKASVCSVLKRYTFIIKGMCFYFGSQPSWY